jgi:hypothetical protein
VTPALGVNANVTALRATLLVWPMPPLQKEPPDEGVANVEPLEVRR